MSYSRIANTLYASTYTAVFILTHLTAWWDREQDENDRPFMSISLLSKIAASAHTFAVGMEVLRDLNLASLPSSPKTYSHSAKAMLVSSVGTLAGVLAPTSSQTNMILGIANASSNFAARLFSNAHLQLVLNKETVVSFDNLAKDESVVVNVDSFEKNQSYRALPSSPTVK